MLQRSLLTSACAVFSGYSCNTARPPRVRHAYRVVKKIRSRLRGSAALVSALQSHCTTLPLHLRHRCTAPSCALHVNAKAIRTLSG